VSGERHAAQAADDASRGTEPAHVARSGPAVFLSFLSIVLWVVAWPFPYRTGFHRVTIAAVALAGIATGLAVEARRAGAIGLATVTFATLLVLTVRDYRDRPVGGMDELVAIGSLRAISSAQSYYWAYCADGGYATDLADLARVAPARGVAFISPDLNANGIVKSRYVFTLSREASAGVINVGSPGKTCNGSLGQPVSAYFAAASPVSRDRGWHFATDNRGIIFFSKSGPIQNPIPPGTSRIE
jgi:hypothetical protein